MIRLAARVLFIFVLFGMGYTWLESTVKARCCFLSLKRIPPDCFWIWIAGIFGSVSGASSCTRVFMRNRFQVSVHGIIWTYGLSQGRGSLVQWVVSAGKLHRA